MNRSAAVPSRRRCALEMTQEFLKSHAVVRAAAGDSRAPVRPRFMVPMHAQPRMEALQD